MVLSAQELYERGVGLANRGRFAAAERTLALASSRADDDDLRARIDGTTAYALTRTGRRGEAEQLCQSALARSGISPRTKATLHGQLGAICAHDGRLDEAEAWLARGIAGLADEPVAAANLRVNRGVVNMQRRDLDAAVADFDEAVRIYAAEGLTDAEAQTRHNLGYLSMLSGDLVSALRAMADAKRILGTDSAIEAAIGDMDRAEVLLDAGQPAEAERILADAARIFGTYRERQARADALVSLARSQLTHDPATASVTAARASRAYRALGSAVGASRAEGVRVRAQLAEGIVNSRGEAVRSAATAPQAEQVEAVAAALDDAGLRADAAAVRLARELRRARRGEADGSPVRVPRRAGIDVQLLAYEVRVARARAAGSHAAVRKHAAAGIEAVSAWRQEIGSLDLQASLSMHAQPLMIAGVESALQSGRPDVVFEWSERARHLSQQVVPLRPPPDPDAAAELAELRMLRADDPAGDWLASSRAAELRERARERQWGSVGVAERHERASLEEVRAGLDDDTAILSYVWARDALACLVTTRSTSRLCALPGWPIVSRALSGLRADLDVSAAVRGGPMADVVRRSLDARLDALSGLLLDGPLAAAGGARRFVATAPGVLSGIPWAMLPALRARPFTLAVSATRWLRLHTESAATGPATASRAAGVAVGPRVARGAEEADAVDAAWRATGRPAKDLRGSAATVDAVMALADDVSVLHVAAHGRHTAENPLFSGLELADGALFGYDIDRMPRLPETVVLSACEVGRSSVRWGEEAIGMTRTWLHAGSRCVIAAPVIVADDIACELLGAVHTGLAAGVAPAEALAEATAATGLVAPFQCHGSGF